MKDTLAWQEYCKTLAPTIQECCSRSPVSGGPAALVKQLGDALPEWQFRHKFSRGGWYRLGGVVDADGGRVAEHLEAWVEAALEAHHGDLGPLLDDLKATPRYATRLVGRTHYLIAPAGEGPADFLQLEVEELQEMRSHRLGEGAPAPTSLTELIDPEAPPAQLSPLGLPIYRFRRLCHVGAVLQRMAIQSPETPILRFLADWQQSSAGHASALYNHWVIALREYLDRYQQTQFRAQPIAILTGLPPVFDTVQGARELKLHSALQAFDREAGYPLAWFFHMLTTKAVPHWVAQIVVEDALAGFAYLPQRDIDVVRHWLHRPYTV